MGGELDILSSIVYFDSICQRAVVFRAYSLLLLPRLSLRLTDIDDEAEVTDKVPHGHVR